MKIFIFMRYLNNFGAPKMFLWVAEHLALEGHKVAVYTFSYNRDVTIPKNVCYIHDNLDHLGFWGKIRNIRKRIKESDADVSISFLLDSNVYNIIACKGLRTKAVVCERSDPFKPHYYKLRFWYPLFRFADGAVYQLPKVAEYYKNIKKNTVVIPNPVTCKSDIAVLPFDSRKKCIVSLGRLDIFQKRQDVLVEAFSIFHKRHSDYNLIIYGSGPDEKKIEKLITNRGLDGCAIMAGNTLTPQASISDSMMFVISSDFEGIPNSLIEAMVIGLPCIATDCRPGGAALLIEDKKNGLLSPKGNAGELARRMEWMVEHPIEADRMGQEAKRIAERFSEEVISKMWSEYVNLLRS